MLQTEWAGRVDPQLEPTDKRADRFVFTRGAKWDRGWCLGGKFAPQIGLIHSVGCDSTKPQRERQHLSRVSGAQLVQSFRNMKQDVTI